MGPRLPVPLRPLTIGDVLDGALEILRTAPRPVVLFTAVLVVPVQVAIGLVGRAGLQQANSFGVLGTPLFVGQVGSDRSNAGIVLYVLASLVLPVLTGLVAWMVASWYGGRSPSAGQVARAVARRVPALLGAWVLVHLAEWIAALACGIGLLVPMTFFLVVAPIIAVEGAGPIAALRRSFHLTRRRFFMVLAVGLLSALVENLVYLALTGIGVLTVELSWGWVVTAALTVAGTLVSKPILAGATVLAYLDLRIRSEGLDLELASGNLGR